MKNYNKLCKEASKLGNAVRNLAIELTIERFEQWCLVELKGKQHAGFVTERTIAGRRFLHIEMPGNEPSFLIINPNTVHSLMPMSEASVRAFIESHQGNASLLK